MGYLQGTVIPVSSYAEIFEMSRQSQPPNVAEDHDDVPQAADLLKGPPFAVALERLEAGSWIECLAHTVLMMQLTWSEPQR